MAEYSGFTPEGVRYTVTDLAVVYAMEKKNISDNSLWSNTQKNDEEYIPASIEEKEYLDNQEYNASMVLLHSIFVPICISIHHTKFVTDEFMLLRKKRIFKKRKKKSNLFHYQSTKEVRNAIKQLMMCDYHLLNSMIGNLQWRQLRDIHSHLQSHGKIKKKEQLIQYITFTIIAKRKQNKLCEVSKKINLPTGSNGIGFRSTNSLSEF